MLRIPMKDHIRNSSQPTDVTFVFHVFQGNGTKQRKHLHDVVFPAHRDRLLNASPYFASLLNGDWKQEDDVSIEECQPGAFRILLRWIYGYRTAIWSIRPCTFVAVLLAAERFGMKELASRLIFVSQRLPTVAVFREILDVLEHRQVECANELNGECPMFIDKLRAVDRFYEILGMVEHRQIVCANELTEKCLTFFDDNATAPTRHASFRKISHELLKKVLARSSLRLREIDLYRATTKWARAQLKRLAQENDSDKGS